MLNICDPLFENVANAVDRRGRKQQLGEPYLRAGWLINAIVVGETVLRTRLRRSLSPRGVGKFWTGYLPRPMGYTHLL